ncbi:MAG TPA: AraC family transcriptional regulator, partial [Pseudomonas sp.]|nr:AraC family transcriptional regulator [Pseudomonas sp.]
LADEPGLVKHIAYAFQAVHLNEIRIVRHAALDGLLDVLSRRMHWRKRLETSAPLPAVAVRTRDYLHAHLDQDIGLDELAAVAGVDRFRLTRAFKASFGLAPHAYLVQLRLSAARKLLRQGLAPANVAMELGFADQSHLGRWFRRTYGLSPAAYRKSCSNLPDC